jgi:hypothetical protein
MNRIFRWLETLSSRPKEHDADDGPKSSGPDANETIVEVYVNHQLVGKEYAQEPREHAPMPDIYTNEDDATVPDLKTLDPDSPDTDKPDDFDPDDTVVLQKK